MYGIRADSFSSVFSFFSLCCNTNFLLHASANILQKIIILIWTCRIDCTILILPLHFLLLYFHASPRFCVVFSQSEEADWKGWNRAVKLYAKSNQNSQPKGCEHKKENLLKILTGKNYILYMELISSAKNNKYSIREETFSLLCHFLFLTYHWDKWDSIDFSLGLDEGTPTEDIFLLRNTVFDHPHIYNSDKRPPAVDTKSGKNTNKY